MKATTRIIALVTGLVLCHGAFAADWKVEDGSQIGFVATYDRIPFQAWFKSFDAHIRFSPDRLDDSSFDVRIATSSLDSDSPDRDEGMKQPAWFAVDKYPEARFQATHFESVAENRYRAMGTLTLKGVSKNVDVLFAWEPQPGGKVWLNANARLERGDFDIGTGEWAHDDTIGFDVGVNASLKLAPR
ncbi:MAG: YceI family protein [Arenicellales bacterium]